MNSDECKSIQDQLIDYIEGDLDESKSHLIRAHLNTCNDCKRHHKETENTIHHLSKNKAPEIPEAFWKAFPEQVFEAYKAQKSENAHAPSNWFNAVSSKFVEFISRPLIPAAIASGIVILVGIMLYPKQDSAPYSPVIAWVGEISNHNNLLKDVPGHNPPADSTAGYGFASNEQANFFRIGQTFFNAVTSTYNGNYKLTEKQLNSISSLSAPYSDKDTVNLIIKTGKQLSAIDESNKLILGKLSKIEYKLSQAAISNGKLQHDLWESALLIAKLDLLINMNKADYLKRMQPHFIKLEEKLKSSNMPPGALTAISNINKILEKNNISSDDAAQLYKLSTQIKQLLG